MFPERFAVKALAAKRNISLLSGQIERFHPEIAVVYDESSAIDLQNMLSPGTGVEILYGEDGYKAAASYQSVDMVVVSFVGASGSYADSGSHRGGEKHRPGEQGNPCYGR